MTVRDVRNNDNPPVIFAPTGLEFQIKNKKLYVPVITLSKENDTKPLEQLKTGFRKTIKWNKHRSQMTVQPRNNNLNDLIDPTFTHVNKCFFFCLLQEIMQVITETLSQIIMYQTLR